MSSYSDKLRDPRWQRMRLQIMERDRFHCVECGSGDNTLNVHHGCYLPGLAPWEYEAHLLHTVCESCHERAQDALAVVHKLLGSLGVAELRVAADVLVSAGVCSIDPPAPPVPPKSDAETLADLEHHIESYRMYGDQDSALERSRYKNRCQLASLIRETMEASPS